MQENTVKIVDWLKKQKAVTRVYYPGLPDHPGHETMTRQSRGFGSMVTFEAESKEKAIKILNDVNLILYAESLAGTESLITYPLTQTHADVPPEFLEKNGITDKVLRLSVGIEAAEDLIADLDQAMNGIGYSQLGAPGLAGCKAAYEHGEEWLDAVKNYIEANIDYTLDYLKEYIPQIKCQKPEGTYLLWMECSGLGLNDEELEDLVIHKANLWLDSGAIFGDSGKGFQRINVACPRATLQKALDQLRDAVNGI